MKKIITRLTLVAMTIMTVLPAEVFAKKVSGKDITGVTESLREAISSVVQPVGAFFIFAAVLMIGFNIIKNKDKADERMKQMEGLLWLGIGAMLIGSALVLGPAIAGMVTT